MKFKRKEEIVRAWQLTSIANFLEQGFPTWIMHKLMHPGATLTLRVDNPRCSMIIYVPNDSFTGDREITLSLKSDDWIVENDKLELSVQSDAFFKEFYAQLPEGIHATLT